VTFNLPRGDRPQAPDGSVVRDAEPPMPTELPLTCEGPLSNVTLALPCAIGMKPLYATECQLSGPADVRRPAIGFISPLEEMSRRLREPVDLGGFVILTSGAITLDGAGFALTKIAGAAVFFDVDPVRRSFTGRLEKLTVSWTSDAGDAITCTALDAPFWAVPGNFL
jgi:hypothetical protein